MDDREPDLTDVGLHRITPLPDRVILRVSTGYRQLEQITKLYLPNKRTRHRRRRERTGVLTHIGQQVSNMRVGQNCKFYVREYHEYFFVVDAELYLTIPASQIVLVW